MKKNSKQSHRRSKLEPLSLEEAMSSPTVDGMLSFLSIRPEELSQPRTLSEVVPRLSGPERTKSIGPLELGRNEISVAPPIVSPDRDEHLTEQTIETHINDSHIGVSHRSELPIGEASPIKRDVLLLDPHICDSHIGITHISELHSCEKPIGVLNKLREEEPLSPNQTIGASPVSHPPMGTSSTNTSQKGPTYRQKIREAIDVQDGHSTGEQLLYQALWRSADFETEQTRLITIGYGGMHDLVKLDKTNCKKNILSLIQKLAVEVVGKYSVRKNHGNTYRVYSYSAILDRRKRAGMRYVVRANGVRFVTPSGVPLRDMTKNSHTGFLPIGESYKSHYSPTGHPRIAPLLDSPTSPIGDLQTAYKERELNNTENTTSSSSPLAPAYLIHEITRILPAIDHSAVESLWHNCRSRAADCKAEEVLYFVESKLPLIDRGKVLNPIGFILSTVPRCFEGETFQAFRAEQLRLEQERQAREAENALREKQIAEELEAYERQKSQKQN